MNLFGGCEKIIMNLFKEVKTMQVLGQLGHPGVPARFHAEEVHFHFFCFPFSSNDKYDYIATYI